MLDEVMDVHRANSPVRVGEPSRQWGRLGGPGARSGDHPGDLDDRVFGRGRIADLDICSAYSSLAVRTRLSCRWSSMPGDGDRPEGVTLLQPDRGWGRSLRPIAGNRSGDGLFARVGCEKRTKTER